MLKPKPYVGLDNDINGGMTDTGKIIRDAWAFGLIPEDETCKGWLPHQIETLWARANAEWGTYGFRVGAMPETLRANYMRIQSQAITRARTAGWSGAQELAND
ncbi:MAG: hypothetical protein OQK00_04490 [Rhodobacteraceae bacterium]|nr:hypothetical protein [Paracoccaceae bacterium]